MFLRLSLYLKIHNSVLYKASKHYKYYITKHPFVTMQLFLS